MNPETFRKFVLELAVFYTFKIVNDHADKDRIQVHINIQRWTTKLMDLVKKYNLHLIENIDTTYKYEITLLEK